MLGPAPMLGLAPTLGAPPVRYPAISKLVVILMSSWSRMWQCLSTGPLVKSVNRVRGVIDPYRGTIAVSRWPANGTGEPFTFVT